MDDEQPQQGYSARLLRRTHGVPTQNKRLQNIEHGLAVRDKIRIINYIQAKPPRRTLVSPVSPHFKCLAEELLSSGADLNAMSTSPHDEDQTSPPHIVGRTRHQSEDSIRQVGFSARKLGQLKLGESDPPSTILTVKTRHQSEDGRGQVGFSARQMAQFKFVKSTPPPDKSPSQISAGITSHSDDSGGQVGFSARKMNQLNFGKSSASTNEASPPAISTGRTRHQSEDGAIGFSFRKSSTFNDDQRSQMQGLDDGVENDGGTDKQQESQLQGQSSTVVTTNDATPTTPPFTGFSARKPIADTKLTSNASQPDEPSKYSSPVSADKIQFAVQSQSPKMPETTNIVGVRTKKAIITKKAITKKAIITKANARRDWQNLRRPGLTSPTLSDCSLSSHGSSEAKPKVEQITEPTDGTQIDTQQEDASVVGFSARKLANKSHLNKSRPISPSSLENGSSAPSVRFSPEIPAMITSFQTPQAGLSPANSNPRISPAPPPSAMSTRCSPEESKEKVNSETSRVGSFSLRSPPPGLGFSARKTPPGLSQSQFVFTEMKTSSQPSGRKLTTDTTLTSQIPGYMMRHPPPGFNTRQPPPGFTPAKMVQAPPGFGPKVSSPPANATRRSSPSAESPSANDPISPPQNTKDSPSSNQTNTVARLARQQIHPYTSTPVPTESSPDRFKIRTLSSAKAELEAIKKAHLVANNTIPPHVRKLEMALERISSKHQLQGLNADKKSDRKSARLPSTSSSGSCVSDDDSTGTGDLVNASSQGDKSVHNGYNQNNSILYKDGNDQVQIKLPGAMWRALSVNYKLLVSNNQKQFAFGVSNLCHLLQNHGKEMDDFNKGGMDKIFTSIRNIILDHSKKLSHRMELLQIVELRAKKWVESEKIVENSTRYKENATTRGSGDGPISTLRASLPGDNTNNNIQNMDKDGMPSQNDRHDRNSHPMLERSTSAPIRLQPDWRNKATTQQDDSRDTPTQIDSGPKIRNGQERLNSDEKENHFKKYSREFLLSCYDSPLTKQIPVMLHYTFVNSDTGYIVERNSEDPRDLIKVTTLPACVRPIEDTHGYHVQPRQPRARRLNSWPGPAFSTIPESAQESQNNTQNAESSHRARHYSATERTHQTHPRPNLGAGILGAGPCVPAGTPYIEREGQSNLSPVEEVTSTNSSVVDKSLHESIPNSVNESVLAIGNTHTSTLSAPAAVLQNAFATPMGAACPPLFPQPIRFPPRQMLLPPVLPVPPQLQLLALMTAPPSNTPAVFFTPAPIQQPVIFLPFPNNVTQR